MNIIPISGGSPRDNLSAVEGLTVCEARHRLIVGLTHTSVVTQRYTFERIQNPKSVERKFSECYSHEGGMYFI